MGAWCFTYKLLEALKTGVADENDDGITTGLELAAHLRNVVPNISPKQTPQYGYFDGEGEFLFLMDSKLSYSKQQDKDKPNVTIQQREPIQPEPNTQYKKTVIGYLGVNVKDVDSNTANRYGLREAKGSYIESVTGSTAIRSGLQKGEIVLEFNNNAISNTQDLSKWIVQNPGKEVILKIINSNGQIRDVKVKIGTWEEIISKDGARMVLIKPQRGHSFYIDIFPVTNAQYRSFIEATGHQEPTSWIPRSWVQHQFETEADWPVIGVSWDDAQAYCKWASKRLQTGWEWYNAFDNRHIYSLSQFKEWCNDWSNYDYSQNESGPKTGQERLTVSYADGNVGNFFKKTFYSNGYAPILTFDDLGFRCAMDVPK